MTHLPFHKTPNSVSSEPGAAQLVNAECKMGDVKLCQFFDKLANNAGLAGAGHTGQKNYTRPRWA
ncbi:MAG: hypothetical protein NVS9B4_28550 [Candidatus Acidiferrum sp.]